MSEDLAKQLGEHVPRMYRVALRIVADAERAEDVVQEACLKALAAMKGFDDRSSLATWLHRITVNCAKDAVRSKCREDRPDCEHELGTLLSGLQVTPAAAAETRELSQLAMALLEKLPEDCRTAFALTQLDGYSYDEAAEIEGQPRGTMASRVYRAKKILLEQMNAHIDGRAKP